MGLQVRQVLEENRYDEFLTVKATKAYGVMEIKLQPYLTSALNGVSGQFCTPSSLSPPCPQEKISCFLINRVFYGSKNGLDEKLNLWE